MAKTRNLAHAIRAELASDPALRDAVDKERFNAELASHIWEARTRANLTQKQLADMVNTHQSVIARLEDADYGGHSMAMLWRIARALNCRLSVVLEPGSSEIAEDPAVCHISSFVQVGSSAKTSSVGRSSPASAGHGNLESSPTSHTVEVQVSMRAVN